MTSPNRSLSDFSSTTRGNTQYIKLIALKVRDKEANDKLDVEG